LLQAAIQLEPDRGLLDLAAEGLTVISNVVEGADGIHRGAFVVGEHRYALTRHWQDTGGIASTVAWIMLNPSTADGTQDDNTIRTCMRLSKSWGYGALWVGNLFTWRATSPADMKAALEPNGPCADDWLLMLASMASTIVCAWGNHGKHRGRASEVRQILADRGLFHVGLTGEGEPRHPLYLPNDTKLQILQAAR
jgi:hypothetical protein